MAKGYCLKNKRGILYPPTFDVTRDGCWGKSFDYLYSRFQWMRPFWKNWEGSIVAAKHRGFEIVRVILTEVGR